MENNIRKLRNERGLKGTKLADLLNITPTYFYEIERGKKRLSADMASKLAEIFGVSVDHLLGRTEENNVPGGHVNPPEWATPKDKRDFKKMLEEDDEIMFDGTPIDEEDREKLKRVMEAIFWDAKKKNKRKPTE